MGGGPTSLQTPTQTPAAPNSALGTLPTETSIHSLSTTNRQNSYRHTQTTKEKPCIDILIDTVATVIPTIFATILLDCIFLDFGWCKAVVIVSSTIGSSSVLIVVIIVLSERLVCLSDDNDDSPRTSI